MLLRPARKAPPGKPLPPPERQKAEVRTFMAPVRGWVTNENLAAAGPGAALVLDNMVPLANSVRVRGGNLLYATAGASEACETLMAWRSGTGSKLFAATASSIIDISNIVDSSVIPAASVTGQTSGDYSFVNMSTSGGSFLLAVNGSDKMRMFDGTTWTQIDNASVPAITGALTTDFSAVWLYKSRLFFIKKNSLTAFAINNVDSIGGSVVSISLGGVMQKGGSLIFGATISTSDAGSGPDDYCVFVSDQGEVAVYQGTDPNDATKWALVGVYPIAEVLHKNAVMRAGGNLLVATKQGLLPISNSMTKDATMLASDAVSRPIEPTWLDYVAARPGKWVVAKWTAKNLALIGFPVDATGVKASFILNLQTGAWGRFTGFTVRCGLEFGGSLYVGTDDGKVYQVEGSGYDDGSEYIAQCVGLHENITNPTGYKQALMARSTWRYQTDFNYRTYFAFNSGYTTLDAPSVAATASGDLWDSGLWDSARWAGTGVTSIKTQWASAAGAGYTVAPVALVRLGGSAVPNVELISIDLEYVAGALVA